VNLPLPRDLAFRAIGRNVANFQRLETALKTLISFERTVGRLSHIQAQIDARVEKRKKTTLGAALGEWLALAKPQAPAKVETPDLFEPWVEISFGMEIDRGYFDENAVELESLAKERNRLIHEQLMSVNFDSEESCAELVKVLDVQNERINHQVALLAPALRDLRELAEWAGAPGRIDQLTEEFIRAVIPDAT
jgi:hypothetical protein